MASAGELLTLLAVVFWFGAAVQINMDIHCIHRKEKLDLSPVSYLVTGVCFLGAVLYWLGTGHLPPVSPQ